MHWRVNISVMSLWRVYAYYICINTLPSSTHNLASQVGVEFDQKQAPGIANAMCKAALGHKMLLLTAGVYEVVRVIPPLTISKEDMAAGIRVLEQCCRDVMGSPKA